MQVHTQARVGRIWVSATTYAILVAHTGRVCVIDRLGTLTVSVESIWLPFLSETL